MRDIVEQYGLRTGPEAMDLDLKAGFDRYARDMFGWQRETPNMLATAAMIFQLSGTVSLWR